MGRGPRLHDVDQKVNTPVSNPVALLEERKELDDVWVLELGRPLALREKLVLLLMVFRLWGVTDE